MSKRKRERDAPPPLTAGIGDLIDAEFKQAMRAAVQDAIGSIHTSARSIQIQTSTVEVKSPRDHAIEEVIRQTEKAIADWHRGAAGREQVADRMRKAVEALPE